MKSVIARYRRQYQKAFGNRVLLFLFILYSNLPASSQPSFSCTKYAYTGRFSESGPEVF